MKTPADRIAYLISRYPAVSHTFILREVLQLKQLGWDVRVASINRPDLSPETQTAEELQETQHTYYVKNEGFLRALKALIIVLFTNPFGFFKGLGFALYCGGADLKKLLFNFFYFVEALLTGIWMQRNDIRHLHVHFATAASSVGLIVTKIFPYTLSFTAHGPDEFYDVSLYNLKEKINGSKFICAIGSYSRSQLMKLSDVDQWPKFEITPMGVDITVFTPRTFRKNPQTYDLLCVGRLVPSKGQHILIKSLDKLVKNGRNIRLHLIGDGPDRISLENEAARRSLKSHILFHGSVSQKHIHDFYNKADIFVSASFAEGIPIVLMEAMAMEIPCVATNINGIPELIRPGIDGLLVSPSDIDLLEQALITLMDDPDLRLKLGRSGRRRVMDKYDLTVNMAHLSRVFTRRLHGNLKKIETEQELIKTARAGIGSRNEHLEVKPRNGDSR